MFMNTYVVPEKLHTCYSFLASGEFCCTCMLMTFPNSLDADQTTGLDLDHAGLAICQSCMIWIQTGCQLIPHGVPERSF